MSESTVAHQMSRVTTTDGFTLHAVAWGHSDRTPIVLVHGYPDSHTVWEPVARRLARDFFVITYDVRGAGASDRPQKLSAYRMDQLSRDLESVVDYMIPGRSFHLAGHDWGGIQAWESLTRPPLSDRILSFTTISGPSLDHAGQLIRNHLGDRSVDGIKSVLEQLAHSWYIGLFHLPIAPHLAWRRGLGPAWSRILAKLEGMDSIRPSLTQTQDGLDGIRLYRANILPRLLRPRPTFVSCPVRILVPTRDPFVLPQLSEGMERFIPKLERIEIDAGHWAQLSHPEVIADHLRAMTQPARRQKRAA